MENEFIEIQKDLFDYFKDVDNKTFSDFIDCFVYHNSTEDTKVSKLSESFLEDNGLVNAYINYIYDNEHPEAYFNRSSMSSRSMIDQIKSGLLSVAYNRFRKSLSQPKAKSTPLGRLSKQEKADLTMVIDNCERNNDDLISDEETTKKMFDVEEATAIIDERKRLRKLYTKILKLIK